VFNLLNTAQPDHILPYCLIALASLLEGPMTILIAGAGISLGKLLPLPAYLAVVGGNLIADLGWYGLGLFGKLDWLERIGPKFGVHTQDVKQLEQSIQEHAPRVLFLSKLTIGLPIPTLIAIGLNRIAVKRWLLAWITGELLKSAIFMAVGYLYAASVEQAYSGLRTVLWIITIVMLVAVFVYFKVRRKKENSRNEQSSSQTESSMLWKRKKTMNQNQGSRGIVLIPAYNEERSIASVVCGILRYLPVLVVDDGSGDETAQRARLAGAMVLQFQENQGKGAALQAGFKQVLEMGYDFVITLDGDGQHDPDEIPLFLKMYAEKPYDLIIGRRDFSQMPIVRRISNTLGSKIFSWAVGKPIPDNQSGYRLISRRLLEVLRESEEDGFEFEVEMIVRCMLRRYKMKWIPIRTIYADEKSYIHPLRHVVKFMQVSLKAHRILRKAAYL
jgi:membrane protein DedA with SNARE-associated domain